MQAGIGEKSFTAAGELPEQGFGPEPTPEELARIQPYALRPLAPNDLYVRRMVLANDAVDRSYEWFPVPVLERLAATLPGKALLIAHDKSQPGQGLIYDAHVRPALPGEAGTHSLVASFYLVKTPENGVLRQQIDGGVARHVSIGFRYDQRRCDVCGGDYYSCPHLPGETVRDEERGTRNEEGRGPASFLVPHSSSLPIPGVATFHYGGDLARYEASEASLVHLGCQRGAVITKGDARREAPGVSQDGAVTTPSSELASDDWRLASGGTTMENDKALARIRELEGEVSRLTGQLKAQADRSGSGAGEGFAGLAEDGKAYRDHLREEVKRLAAILKCEAEANLLLSALPHAGAKELVELVDSYQKRVAEKFPPRGLGFPASAGQGRGDGASGPVGAPARPVQF